jgi:2-dehydro-3-deoxyphosphogluconate aldolase/(4S)-4-hydroxy-2-oxoglutarate aldolase
VLDQLHDQAWVPVLRNADAGDAVATARACAVDVVELTYSTPGVLDAIRELVAGGSTVGVGTVRTTDQVREAAAAGASFVVSFHRPPGFVAAALDAGVVPLPGALTPHEVAAAIDDGAPAVKIFPARLVPPAYLRDLAAVIGPVPLVVTGGIGADPESLRPWLAAGAWAVGVGGQLGTVAGDGAEVVRQRASALKDVSRYGGG